MRQLAPMAVVPSHQRQGIGSKLVEAGLKTCQERGDKIVVVLGHPDFYPRFGFSSELAKPLKSPFGGGEEEARFCPIVCLDQVVFDSILLRGDFCDLSTQ